jgi:hypothetical protein
MSIKATKYIRKALYVDAVRVTEENFDELAKWCQGDITSDGNRAYIRVRVHTPKSERQTRAFVGDWILYTDRGYKIYSNNSFVDNFILAVNEDNEEVKA